MDDDANRSMQDLRPTVWIGKQGCSETMIGEIVSQLKKRKLIKVKWLQNTDVDPEAVARQAKARLVEVRGRTMVLREKGRAGGVVATAAKAVVKPTAKVSARASLTASKTPVKEPRTGHTKNKPGLSGIKKRAKK
jgi:RNA-binding protein